MASIKSSGVFADEKSGGGIFRGHNYVDANSVHQRVTGVPIDLVSKREWGTLFYDFINNDDIINWVVSNLTSGTAVITPESINGAMQLTATTANQGLGSVQIDDASVDNATAFLTPAANRVIIMEAGVTINDVSNADWFIGLGETDTTFVAATGVLAANGADNHAGFHHLVADAGVPTLSVAGVALANVQSTQLSAGVDYAGNTITATISDATQHKYGIRIEGVDTCEFYLDDELVHVVEYDNDLAEQIVPTFGLIANGSAITMDVDYLLVAQTR